MKWWLYWEFFYFNATNSVIILFHIFGIFSDVVVQSVLVLNTVLNKYRIKFMKSFLGEYGVFICFHVSEIAM